MKKRIAIALLTCAALGTAIGARSAVLEEGTLVLVKVLDRITTKEAKSGDIVLFEVANQVENEAGQMVIRKGAAAFGHVVDIPLDKPASLDLPPEPEWKYPERRALDERMQKLREKFGATENIPENIRKEFHDKSLPVIFWNGLLTFNFRSFWLFLFCLLDVPVMNFLWEIVGMGLLYLYVNRRHENFCKKIADSL